MVTYAEHSAGRPHFSLSRPACRPCPGTQPERTGSQPNHGQGKHGRLRTVSRPATRRAPGESPRKVPFGNLIDSLPAEHTILSPTFSARKAFGSDSAALGLSRDSVRAPIMNAWCSPGNRSTSVTAFAHQSGTRVFVRSLKKATNCAIRPGHRHRQTLGQSSPSF